MNKRNILKEIKTGSGQFKLNFSDLGFSGFFDRGRIQLINKGPGVIKESIWANGFLYQKNQNGRWFKTEITGKNQFPFSLFIKSNCCNVLTCFDSSGCKISAMTSNKADCLTGFVKTLEMQSQIVCRRWESGPSLVCTFWSNLGDCCIASYSRSPPKPNPYRRSFGHPGGRIIRANHAQAYQNFFHRMAPRGFSRISICTANRGGRMVGLDPDGSHPAGID